MDVGFIGLGKMGLNMVRRLRRDEHRIVAFDRSAEATHAATEAGATAASSVADVVTKLDAPRAVWLMLPAGEITQAVIDEVSTHLAPGDILIDGGNTRFHDTIARYEAAKTRGIRFVDVGTSGGIWGLREGYCLMVGGDRDAFDHIEPLLRTLAPPEGCLYCGAAGAGHYVKMVHNGIEYGMLQAYAEGFEILEASRYDLDLRAVSALWNRGSVVRSWLLEMCERAFESDPHLEAIGDHVADSGEGRWTVQEAMDLDVPAPVITLSLLARFRSRQDESFGAKVIAALRNEFGGHATRKKA
ncbi:MAG: decarboxylating 6-phosphogluconate dehydrogenase [Deltaproteobacteria bacterium]|nr:decarboxylating 6-phosphogluconate dehydrogenase [Deltaproteobacteria bacterium]